MPGKTNYSAENWLEYITGKTAMPTMPTAYVALLTVIGADAGTGFTECTIDRKETTGTDWNASSSGTPRYIDTAADLTFAAPTPASPEAAIAWALFDASSGGNMLFQDYLGNHQWKPATVAAADPGVIFCPSHGLSDGDTIVISTKLSLGGSVPSGFAGPQTVSGVTTDTFEIGLEAVTAGSFMFRKVTTYTVATGSTVTIAAGGLVIRDA